MDNTWSQRFNSTIRPVNGVHSDNEHVQAQAINLPGDLIQNTHPDSTKTPDNFSLHDVPMTFTTERLSSDMTEHQEANSDIPYYTLPPTSIREYQSSLLNGHKFHQRVVPELLSHQIEQTKVQPDSPKKSGDFSLKDASFIAERLSVEIATELIMSSMLRVPDSAPSTFDIEYRPMHSIDTKLQRRVVAELLLKQIKETKLAKRMKVLEAKAALGAHVKSMAKLGSKLKTEDLHKRLDLALAWLYEEYVLLARHQLMSSQEPSEGSFQEYNSLLCDLVTGIENVVGEDRDVLLARLYLEAPLITEDAVEALKKISLQESRGRAPLMLLRDLAIRRPNRRSQQHVFDVLSYHVTHDDEMMRDKAIGVLSYREIARPFLIYSIINLYNGQLVMHKSGFSKCIFACTDSDAELKTELCKEITECMDRYLTTTLLQATSVKPCESFLDFYVGKFESFRVSNRFLSDACDRLRGSIPAMYKNTLYIIDSIYDLSMICWMYHMHTRLERQITESFCAVVERERNGESVDTKLMSGVVDSYVELEKIKKILWPKKIIYRNLEAQFLQDTTKFYARKSCEFLCCNSVTDYMRQVEQWLLEEERRAQTYFQRTTGESLKNACENVLIEEQLYAFYSVFENLLDDENKDDLARIYSLVSKVYNGLYEMKNIFEYHIVNRGSAAVREYVDTASNDSKVYVNTILDIYKKYETMVTSLFQNDRGLLVSVEKGCRRFVNANAVTKAANSSSKSAVLLAMHCDSLLKKSRKNLNKAELEEALNDVMIVFNFLEDKDVFQEFYLKTRKDWYLGIPSARTPRLP